MLGLSARLMRPCLCTWHDDCRLTMVVLGERQSSMPTLLWLGNTCIALCQRRLTAAMRCAVWLLRLIDGQGPLSLSLLCLCTCMKCRQAYTVTCICMDLWQLTGHCTALYTACSRSLLCGCSPRSTQLQQHLCAVTCDYSHCVAAGVVVQWLKHTP
jgi:hypothetical protein